MSNYLIELMDKYIVSYINRDIFKQLFLFFLLISWSLYPHMVKFIMPIAFKIFVAGSFFLLLVFSLKYKVRNKLVYTNLEKIILVLISIYLIVLFLSSLVNATFNSVYQYLIYLSKYMVLVFIILYIDTKVIYKSFKYYAYISIVIVIVAIFVGIGVTFNLFTYSESLTNMVGNGFKVYYGSYYSYSDINWFGIQIYRLQGLSEEAGTFALSLIPALLWFLLVEKSIVKYSIIMIGLIWSFSVASFLLFPIFIYLLYKINFDKLQINLLISGFVIFFLIFFRDHIMFFISDSSFISDNNFASNRIVSFTNRIGDVEFYIEYLMNMSFIDKLVGIGAGNAFMPVYGHSISIGYLVKLVESGLIGGVAYGIAFILFLYLSFDMIFTSNKYTNQNLVILIAFSSIACVLIAFLRQSADTSFWQMWIYGSLFYYRMVRNNEYFN